MQEAVYRSLLVNKNLMNGIPIPNDEDLVEKVMTPDRGKDIPKQSIVYDVKMEIKKLIPDYADAVDDEIATVIATNGLTKLNNQKKVVHSAHGYWKLV